MSFEITEEGYTILNDGTVDIESIPSIKKCNACLRLECTECGYSNKCHCGKYHHGIPRPKDEATE